MDVLMLLIHIVGFCSGLHHVYVQIPMAVEKGNSAALYCWYMLEEPLYAVKWYKGGREFYRYTPADSPPTKTFPSGSLKVDLAESTATRVTLVGLDFDDSGVYTCEVTEDMPSLQTAVMQGRMNVVELPTEMPVISGLQRPYRIGDTLKLNCTSGRSRPAANLTWYVNDRQPHHSHVRTHGQLSNDSEWTTSQLQFLVHLGHFRAGKLTIRCSASIYDIYWQSVKISAEEEAVDTMVDVNDFRPSSTSQIGLDSNGHPNVGAFFVEMQLLASLLLTLEWPVIVLLACSTNDLNFI